MKRFKHKRTMTDSTRDLLLTTGFCACIIVGVVVAYAIDTIYFG